jgi:enolase
MPVIERLSALEILDSRGRPTVSATCRFSSGVTASASVPSGASTGSAEALELRDGDPSRYGGLGCRRAVQNIRGEIDSALRGNNIDLQSQVDLALIALDGTENKSRLGANAILAVSLAFARASALERGLPLYNYFATLLAKPPQTTLPRLTVNLFSGGKHAGGQVEVQDVLVVPRSATTIDESLAMVYAIYQSAFAIARQKYGIRMLRADEGGLAPPFESVDVILQDAVEAISSAGLQPGADVALAVDIASSHFYKDQHYHIGGKSLSSSDMIEQIDTWIRSYPIVSVEDGLAEDDWEGWPVLRKRLEGRALALGDDHLCTNPQRIQRAIEAKSANALLLKVNQIGTLSEAARANERARSAGWDVVVSARSGETEDHWLADLAVGWAADYIKVGSITQSERLAKYNRLLAIEHHTRWPLATWPKSQ